MEVLGHQMMAVGVPKLGKMMRNQLGLMEP